MAKEGQGRGLGRVLYSSLERLLELQQIRNLYACITGDNFHSIGLHQALGYKLVGTFPKAGFKHGRWLDVVWLAKSLEAKLTKPDRMIPFCRLSRQKVEAVLLEINKA